MTVRSSSSGRVLVNPARLRELPNATWVDSDGQLVTFPTLPLLTDLDEIPSPYLTGILDPLDAGGES